MVEYDPDTMAITINVPAHHNIDASTVIIHKQSVRLYIQKIINASFNFLLSEHYTFDGSPAKDLSAVQRGG